MTSRLSHDGSTRLEDTSRRANLLKRGDRPGKGIRPDTVAGLRAPEAKTGFLILLLNGRRRDAKRSARSVNLLPVLNLDDKRLT